jgi:hypothetical protein
MAERSIAAVLKTVEGNTSGGSNPPFSANEHKVPRLRDFLFKRKCEIVAKFCLNNKIKSKICSFCFRCSLSLCAQEREFGENLTVLNIIYD